MSGPQRLERLHGAGAGGDFRAARLRGFEILGEEAGDAFRPALPPCARASSKWSALINNIPAPTASAFPIRVNARGHDAARLRCGLS
jgi:hypothetical protein